MSSLLARHPEQDLVAYLDGELSARSTAKVDRHLESCGQCRAELDELKDALAECGRYQVVQKAELPEAPNAWRDLYRDFSRIDESLATDSLLVRLTRPLVHSGVPRWSLMTGLAVLIALISLHQLRQAPSVEAASILRKAVQVSETKPRVAHRVRIRTSHQQEFTRLAGGPAALIQVAETPAVAALFQAAHFDLIDPLSARAFEQWRDQQIHKSDEVTAVAHPQAPSESLTRIRTVAAEGELAAASITLDAADYRPVEERLEFRDREWVELSEIAEASTESAGPTVAARGEVPVRAAEPPSRSAAFAPGSSASISDELQVLSVISAIEADLGEHVEVSLSEGKVLVTGGDGIPPQRQKEIRDSLANLPHVAVEFTELPPAAAPSHPAAAGNSSVATTVSPMQSRLQKQLGGHAEFDRFSTQLLDLDDMAMQRVYALHRLAQKFSPEEEAQLSSNDLNVLHEISRKYTAVLGEKLGGMERILLPTLSAMGGTAAATAPTAHASWQPAAEELYRNGRRVEVLVSQMLGMTPGNASTSGLPSELLTAMRDLRANLDECQKYLQAR